MSEVALLNLEGVERQTLADFAEKAYLDYSMYVILDRALPNIRDGLKPVQRRIVYAMSELGLSATAKYKKSARTIGDVLGKFHPHGDTACYEAMALMAQSFSYRYPLVDGQGNWGSPDDPKSFAAMRYTESRLNHYAEVLLSELGQGTVDWAPNFDGTLKEPVYLPARLPNILLNGASGIAVGMATDIPPHNMREVGAALVHLLDNPKAGIEELMSHIQGPDYPSEAEIITPKEAIASMYRTGLGSIKQRAVYCKEEGVIVVTALPHQASGSKILEQIAQQMRTKKLPMIEDLRDESDHENPTRLILMPKSNRVDCDEVMAHLFATTDLERSYRVNLNIVGVNGKPQVKDLKQILKEWLSFRLETVKRRVQYRLDKVLARLHILDGLLIAFLNLDEVIRIIREAEHPKQALIDRFALSELQANAILDTRLRHLARLAEMNIRAEQEALAQERDKLQLLLSSDARIKTLVKKEIIADVQAHGDVRRSAIVQRQEAQALKAKDVMPAEAISIILSKKSWVRQAKGHDFDVSGLNYKTGDGLLQVAKGCSNQLAIFLDSSGRSYALPAHSLPSARSQGEPLTGRLSPPSGAHFVAVLAGDESDRYVMASDAGYGFVVSLQDLIVRNKAGKVVLKLPQGALPLVPQRVVGSEHRMLAAVSNEGRLLCFALKDLPQLVRGKGNKIIGIPSKRAAAREEWMQACVVLGPGDALLIHSGKRTLTLKARDLQHYQGERGRRGSKLPRGFQRVDHLSVLA